MTRAGAIVAASLVLVSRAVSAKEHRVTTIASLQHPHDLAAQTQAIELFVIPQEISTRTTILPSHIEAFSEVEKRTLTSAADRAAFFTALEAAKPVASAKTAEFRIKAVLTGHAGARIAELYASAIAPYGMLGSDTFLTYGSDTLAQYVVKAVHPTEVR